MTKTIKPFHNQNGYTAFNNYILDHIMPSLSPNAWKVLCFIIRKTSGWQKPSDDISFSQIRDGTGIGSDPTVLKSLEELEQNQHIIITRTDEQWKSNNYRLNLDFSITIETIVEDTIETTVGSTIETIDTKEKRKTKKERLPKGNGSNPSPLLPDTEFSRMFFEILKTEFHAKGRRAPQKFPSLACKRKFDARATYLNGNLKNAVERALEKGILSIPQITDFIAKWEPSKNGHKPIPSQTVPDSTTERGKQLQKAFAKAGAGKA